LPTSRSLVNDLKVVLEDLAEMQMEATAQATKDLGKTDLGDVRGALNAVATVVQQRAEDQQQAVQALLEGR
jgi:hypothetical protein